MLPFHSDLWGDVLVLKKIFEGGGGVVEGDGGEGWSFLGLKGEVGVHAEGTCQNGCEWGRFNFTKVFCKLALSFSQFFRIT